MILAIMTIVLVTGEREVTLVPMALCTRVLAAYQDGALLEVDTETGRDTVIGVQCRPAQPGEGV